MTKKIDTKGLVGKIEKITKERISKEKVVSLSDFRKAQGKDEPITILVIEDDITIRRSLQRIFEDEGYKVISAEDGTELSKVLDDEASLDLIILDVGLPWINGIELCQLMKQSKDLLEIPLIFVSALDSKQDIQRGFDAGADDYITKPFDIDKIKKVVKTLLKISE